MKKEDATPEGVSEVADQATEDSTPEIKPVNPREAAMNAVVSSRSQVLASEGIEQGEPEEPTEEVVEDDSEPQDVIEEPDELPQKPSGPTVSVTLSDGTVVDVPESSVKVPVKIDGEEAVESLDKISRSYQKESAASKRLEEAAKKAQELEQRERNLLLREQNLQPSTPDVAQTPSTSPSNEDVKEMARKVYESMTVGSEDEAIEALQNVLGRQQTTQINPQLIAEQATQDAVRAIEGRQAGEWFKSEYKEIVADDNLFRLTDAAVDQLLASNPNMTYREAFKTAGDRTMEWVNQYKPDPAPDELQQRREKKRVSSQSIPKASAKSSIGQDAPPSPTKSDVIADMKRRRGQPT